MIAKPLDEEKLGKKECEQRRSKALAILDKVKTRLAEMTDAELETSTLDQILKHENVGVDSHDYHDALAISTRGNVVIMKRKPNEQWVNNYNPHFMKAWMANMDIQFCMDSYAVITYITDYLTKGDAGLTKAC